MSEQQGQEPVPLQLEAWSRLAARWHEEAVQAGRSPSPRARHLRARSRALETHLGELRKRIAAADQIAAQIAALIVQESADVIEEERAA